MGSDKQRMVMIPIDIFVLLCEDYGIGSRGGVPSTLDPCERLKIQTELRQKLIKMYRHDTYTPRGKLPNIMVKNQHGICINFQLAIVQMDEDLRARIYETAPYLTEQEIYNAYCSMHQKKFGKPFDYELITTCK